MCTDSSSPVGNPVGIEQSTLEEKAAVRNTKWLEEKQQEWHSALPGPYVFS